jgi:hypothetical protein
MVRSMWLSTMIYKIIGTAINRNIIFIRSKLGSWQYKPDDAQAYARPHKHAMFPVNLITGTHQVNILMVSTRK